MHIERLSSDRIENPVASLSQGVKAGPYLFLSAQTGLLPGSKKLVTSYSDLPDAEGRSFATGRLAPDSWSGPVRAQCWQMFKNIEGLLSDHGATLNDILRINMWLTDFRDLPALMPVRTRPFSPEEPPPITNIGASELCLPGAKIQAEVVALLPESGFERVPIPSKRVSQSVGDYLLATRGGSLGWPAGMIAARNDTGEIVRSIADLKDEAHHIVGGGLAQADVEETAVSQTQFILRDLQMTLVDNGLTLDDVAKLTVYIRDFREWPPCERLLSTFFGNGCPPLTIVGCTELGVDDFRLEIEATFAIGVPCNRRVVDSVPHVVSGAATTAVTADFVFVSGQLGIATNGKLVTSYDQVDKSDRDLSVGSLASDWRDAPAASQTLVALRNLSSALGEANSSLDRLVKMNIYVTEGRDIPIVERIVSRVFGSAAPAGGIVQVPALPLKQARVEIDGIALADQITP
jgi:enamine deaminase RidA (YjgF/YER057c/UK114 family)